VDTLLSEVRAMQKEMEEFTGFKEEQDSLLLNYWRSEGALHSDMTHARCFEGEQCKENTEDALLDVVLLRNIPIRLWARFTKYRESHLPWESYS
jgi:hypothetical protein